MVATIVVDEGGFDGESFSRRSIGQWAGLALMGASGHAVRTGVLPRNGNPLGYVPTTALKATLKAGDLALWTPAGVTPMSLEADIEFTHETAHASQPRRDLVIAEVIDTGTSATIRRFRIVKGAAGSGAPLPSTNWIAGNAPGVGTPGTDPGEALGNGAWVALHQVLINANATTLTQVVDVRPWTSSAGGPLRRDGALATPSLASDLPPDTLVYDGAVGLLGVRDSAAGLVEYSSGRRVASFSLNRSAVPVGAGGTGDTGVDGYKLAFAAASSDSTPNAPAYTTTDSATQLILTNTGLYQFFGSIDFRGAGFDRVPTNAGRIGLQTSADNGATWTEYPGGGVFFFSANEWITSFTSVVARLSAGNRVRVAANRMVSGTGTADINGRLSVELVRVTS